jgi:hypothetical protein
MVRIFNPESSDWTEKLIRFIFYKKTDEKQFLSNKAEQGIERLLDEENSKFYKEFKSEFGDSFYIPNIELRSGCRSKEAHSSNREFFPASYHIPSDSIKVCTNFIKSENELNENILRETYFANYLSKQNDKTDLDTIIEGYVKGCRKGMQVYFNEREALNRSSNLCAEYIVKYRDFNVQRYPFDQWSRLVKLKIAESSYK